MRSACILLHRSVTCPHVDVNRILGVFILHIIRCMARDAAAHAFFAVLLLMHTNRPYTPLPSCSACGHDCCSFALPLNS